MARRLFPRPVPRFSSEAYWVDRYKAGQNSGDGSYGELATFKAEILNRFVAKHGIASVIEFGCGDGNQLTLATYPRYVGFDVSPEAIRWCREKFRTDSTKTFRAVSEYRGEKAELALSLDVLYHLVEEAIYLSYLERLFDAAEKYVIIYAADKDDNPPTTARHECYRKFTAWVAKHRPDWKLIDHIPNRYDSWAEFYVYERG